jgi:hypothetical protein
VKGAALAGTAVTAERMVRRKRMGFMAVGEFSFNQKSKFKNQESYIKREKEEAEV